MIINNCTEATLFHILLISQLRQNVCDENVHGRMGKRRAMGKAMATTTEISCALTSECAFWGWPGHLVGLGDNVKTYVERIAGLVLGALLVRRAL